MSQGLLSQHESVLERYTRTVVRVETVTAGYQYLTATECGGSVYLRDGLGLDGIREVDLLPVIHALLYVASYVLCHLQRELRAR
jgi:hypothetical protein